MITRSMHTYLWKSQNAALTSVAGKVAAWKTRPAGTILALSLDSLGVHSVLHTSVCQHLVVIWQAAIVCQGVPELADHEGGLSCPHVVPHVAAVEAPHKVQPVRGACVRAASSHQAHAALWKGMPGGIMAFPHRGALSEEPQKGNTGRTVQHARMLQGPPGGALMVGHVSQSTDPFTAWGRV